MILVSACLLGFNYKYSGGNNLVPKLIELLKGREVCPVCPEVAGGLSVPRPPAEIIVGDGFDVLANKSKVLNIDGGDVTDYYLLGSKKMLTGIDEKEVEFAILKARSPACGVRYIYSGDFNGKLKPGVGVGTAFLVSKGIPVFTENELDKIRERLD